LSEKPRYTLSFAAWLHNIGNLATPRFVLSWPSPPLKEEMEDDEGSGFER
jgi:response regulator RpfG family c-di-GMP phosphodiesterase